MGLLTMPGDSFWQALPVAPWSHTALHILLLVIAVQLSLLFCLVVWTIIMRRMRNIAQYEAAEKRESCEKLVLDLLLAHMESPDTQPHVPQLLASDKPHFKRILLEHILSLKGNEQKFLVDFYTWLGFLSDDLAQLKSMRWWHRLEAVSKLECLGTASHLKALTALVDDPHPLVAIAAMRVTSQLAPSAPVVEHILKSLAKRNAGRRDVIIEILFNIGSQTPEGLASFLKTTPSKDMQCAALEVLGMQRAADHIPSILPFLDDPSEEVVWQAVRALRQIGDPIAALSFERMTLHRSPRIRAEALQGLGLLGGSCFETALETLKDDASIEVRRVAFALEKEVAGA